MEELLYIVGQILGGVAVVLGFLAFQRKTQLGIIIFQLITALTFSFHYFFIHAFTAVALNLLSAAICVCFGILNKQKRDNRVETIVSVLLIILAGTLAWENIVIPDCRIGRKCCQPFLFQSPNNQNGDAGQISALPDL